MDYPEEYHKMMSKEIYDQVRMEMEIPTSKYYQDFIGTYLNIIMPEDPNPKYCEVVEYMHMHDPSDMSDEDIFGDLSDVDMDDIEACSG